MVAAVVTSKKACRIDHFKVPPLDVDGFAVDDRVGDCLAGSLYNAAESGSRNTHAPSGVFVRQTLQVGEANRFAFIHRQPHLVEIQHGNAARLKIAGVRFECDKSIFLRPDHYDSFMR
jgi:hypothetical protein